MWMEDSEKEDLTKETLFRQFSIVRKETNTSHVQARFFLFITIFIEYYNSYEYLLYNEFLQYCSNIFLKHDQIQIWLTLF